LKFVACEFLQGKPHLPLTAKYKMSKYYWQHSTHCCHSKCC